MDFSFRPVEGTYRSNLILFALVLVMLAFGLITLLSGSAFLAREMTGNSFFYFNKQILYAILGIGLMFVFSQTDYRIWIKAAWPIYIISLILLVLVYIPPIGKKAGGAWRWISLGPISLQPSDLARFAVVLVISRLASGYREYPFSRIALIGSIVITPVLLILFEQDLSTALHIFILAGFLLLFTPFPLFVHASFFTLAIPAVALMIYLEPFRLERIKAVVDPWKFRFDSAYQLVASMKSFLSGGMWGKGLGEGLNRHNLQARHTDFILAIAAEDTGFAGTLLLLTVMFAFALYGLFLISQQEDDFPRLLGTGIVLSFITQVILNAAVVMGLVPTTGIGLPLFSYGGTSLLVYLSMFGIFLSTTRERVLQRSTF